MKVFHRPNKLQKKLPPCAAALQKPLTAVVLMAILSIWMVQLQASFVMTHDLATLSSFSDTTTTGTHLLGQGPHLMTLDNSNKTTHNLLVPINEALLSLSTHVTTLKNNRNPSSHSHSVVSFVPPATVENALAFQSWNASSATSPNDDGDPIIPRFLFNYTEAKKIGCCNTSRVCFFTCYTQAACDDSSLYPFASVAEQEWFQPAPGQQQELRLFCNQYMDQDPVHHPDHPTKNDNKKNSTTTMAEGSTRTDWCPFSTTATDRNRTATTTSTKIELLSKIPMGCSKFSMGGRSGPFDRTFLIPRGKLVICGIPKVGITQWFKFARFLLGAADYQSIPWIKQDLSSFFLDKLPRHRQEEILSSPEWTRAVFFRDPAERLLSAYLDKVVGTTHRLQRRQNGQNVDTTTTTNITTPSFAQWIESLVNETSQRCPDRRGPSWCWNPHWRPQVYSCGIKPHTTHSSFLPLFEFVGSLSQAANHSKALLQKVGLWDDHGAHYISSPKARGCNALPPNPHTLFPHQPGVSAPLGFQQSSRGKHDSHTKGSQNKMDEYYTPELLAVVQQLYHQDYEVWNALQHQQNEGRWVSGHVLQEQLSSQHCPTSATAPVSVVTA